MNLSGRKESTATALADARRLRRQRNLGRIEIPETQVTVTDELLGKGGFGAVYLADFNGRNAAAKVRGGRRPGWGENGGRCFRLHRAWVARAIFSSCGTSSSPQRTAQIFLIGFFKVCSLVPDNRLNFLRSTKVLSIDHKLGSVSDHGSSMECKSDTTQAERVNEQREAFLKELEAMVRLRSPHTVNVFGAITARKDRLVLVMELLSGGDLHEFLQKSKEPLPTEHARRIICDVCAGMAFCHSKDAVHGDLKSANVLLDGAGRAKVGRL